jgi:tRNA modification GTPase
VAVILVDGPGARDAIRQFFVPVTAWKESDPETGRIVLGCWGGADGEELIVCRRGDERFEIHCHGGGAAATAIIGQLVSRGCRVMTWQEWVRSGCSRVTPLTGSLEGAPESASSPRRIFDRRDAATLAAQIALANAPTLRTACVLLDQFHGALTTAVDRAREAVKAANLLKAGELIENVLRYRDVGLHLTSPWRVVLAGPPNVGKSSLINAIAGFQRAIVSPVPGTTRDVVTVNTAIDGWPVQLADTAGLRDSRDELELAGVALADDAIREADLVLAVYDASEGNATTEVVGRMPKSMRVIFVGNKVDLMTKGARVNDPTAGGGNAPARCSSRLVSALTGEGIAELIAAIGDMLVPSAPPPGAAVAFTSVQVAHLECALQAVHEQHAVQAEAALAALLACE